MWWDDTTACCYIHVLAKTHLHHLNESHTLPGVTALLANLGVRGYLLVCIVAWLFTDRVRHVRVMGLPIHNSSLYYIYDNQGLFPFFTLSNQALLMICINNLHKICIFRQYPILTHCHQKSNKKGLFHYRYSSIWETKGF